MKKPVFNAPLPANIAGEILKITASLEAAGDEHHANWLESLLDATHPKIGDVWENANGYRAAVVELPYSPQTDEFFVLLKPESSPKDGDATIYREADFAKNFRLIYRPKP